MHVKCSVRLPER